MYELLVGKTPFFPHNVDNYETLLELEGVIKSGIKQGKIHYPQDFPTLAKNLLGKVLKLKPSKRMTGDQILNHPWFAGLHRYHKEIVDDDFQNMINNRISQYEVGRKSNIYNDFHAEFTMDEIKGLRIMP